MSLKQSGFLEGQTTFLCSCDAVSSKTLSYKSGIHICVSWEQRSLRFQGLRWLERNNCGFQNCFFIFSVVLDQEIASSQFGGGNLTSPVCWVAITYSVQYYNFRLFGGCCLILNRLCPRQYVSMRDILTCMSSFATAYKWFGAEDVNVDLRSERPRWFNSFSHL